MPRGHRSSPQPLPPPETAPTQPPDSTSPYCQARAHLPLVILVTTLLDRDAYPVHALSKLYLRRWEMELTMRHLKVTLQMDRLSCKTPENKNSPHAGKYRNSARP